MRIEEVLSRVRVLAVVVLALAGCRVYAPPKLAVSETRPALPPARGTAILCAMGTDALFKGPFAWIADNGKTVGGLGHGTGFCYELDPGLHQVRAEWAEMFTELEVVAVAGHRIDLAIEPAAGGPVLWQIGPKEGEEMRRSTRAAVPLVDASGAAFHPPKGAARAKPIVRSGGRVTVCLQHFGSPVLSTIMAVHVTPVRPIVDGVLQEELDEGERRCIELSSGAHRFAFTPTTGGFSADELTLELVPGPRFVVTPRIIRLGNGFIYRGGDPIRYGAERR